MATQDPRKVILAAARSGPIRTRDLERLGVHRRYLQMLCDEGALYRISRGLYVASEPSAATELHTVAQVAKRIPHGTVCLLTALQIHGLSTEVPAAVWIMIDRKARYPAISQPRVSIIRASGQALTHGVQERTIEGVATRITTPAKTVADCFRYPSHVGHETALQALRDYLAQYRGGVNALIAAAQADRAYAKMKPFIEASV